MRIHFSLIFYISRWQAFPPSTDLIKEELPFHPYSNCTYFRKTLEPKSAYLLYIFFIKVGYSFAIDEATNKHQHSHINLIALFCNFKMFTSANIYLYYMLTTTTKKCYLKNLSILAIVLFAVHEYINNFWYFIITHNPKLFKIHYLNWTTYQRSQSRSSTTPTMKHN